MKIGKGQEPLPSQEKAPRHCPNCKGPLRELGPRQFKCLRCRTIWEITREQPGAGDPGKVLKL